MDCREYEEIVAADADGVLDPVIAREAAAHLEQCADCRALRAQVQQARMVVRERAPRLATPPEVRSRIAETLDSEREMDTRVAIDSHPRRRMRIVIAGAIAALLLLVFALPDRTSPPDLIATIAEDVQAARENRLSLALQTDAIGEVQSYFGASGRFPFVETAGDMSGLGLQPVGAAIGEIRGVPTTLTLYQGGEGQVICRRFQPGSLPLPPGGERIGDMVIYEHDGVMIRIQQTSNFVCALASAMPREAFFRLLVGHAH